MKLSIRNLAILIGSIAVIAVLVNFTHSSSNARVTTISLKTVAPDCDDASATETARVLCMPRGIAFDDRTGSIVVADGQRQTIRVISRAGDVTVLAGRPYSGASGIASFDPDTSCRLKDGVGPNARFCWPGDIVYDSNSGDYLVADTLNNAIRRVTARGVTTTIAKGPAWNPRCRISSSGFVAAVLCRPVHISLDASSGSIVFSDRWNRLMRLSSNGSISWIAGIPNMNRDLQYCKDRDGDAFSAEFCEIHGFAVDRDGTIYVASWPSNSIRAVSATGVVRTLAGFGNPLFNSTMRSTIEHGLLHRDCFADDGIGWIASFCGPEDVVVNSKTGDMYVSDSLNGEIRLVTPRGRVFTIAGKSPRAMNVVSHDGYGASAVFCGPLSLALDAAHNILFVNDGVCGIRKVDLVN
jgi:DNA-binding beta-propeller fold protein YncE